MIGLLLKTGVPLVVCVCAGSCYSGQFSTLLGPFWSVAGIFGGAMLAIFVYFMTEVDRVRRDVVEAIRKNPPSPITASNIEKDFEETIHEVHENAWVLMISLAALFACGIFSLIDIPFASTPKWLLLSKNQIIFAASTYCIYLIFLAAADTIGTVLALRKYAVTAERFNRNATETADLSENPAGCHDSPSSAQS